MVDIVRHEHHRHLWHILIKVVHVLYLHGVKESVRLSEIRRAAEPIRWRQHRRRLLQSSERRASTDVWGARDGIAIREARLPIIRGRCARERRWGTRAGGVGSGHGRCRTGPGPGPVRSRNSTRDRRRSARSRAVWPGTRVRHGVGRRGPGARQDGLLGVTARCTTVKRRGGTLVRVWARPDRWMVGGRISRGRRISGICCRCDGRWRCDRALIRRGWLTTDGISKRSLGIGASSPIGEIATLPTPEVNAIHAPLEITHGVRVRSIRATHRTGDGWDAAGVITAERPFASAFTLPLLFFLNAL